MSNNTFENLGLGGEILEGINCLGFKTPTPIQEQAIPAVIQGRDIIGCAQTGTGKTGAFLIPILDKISKEKSNKVNTLIIVPTRELAVQIDQQATGLAYFSSISTYPVYGGGSGSSFEQEKQSFISGTDIIIATPGRLIMHINQNYVDFSGLKHLILDEADRMLDMGFMDDIMRIISKLPVERQTLLFSATMPPKIRKLAESILKDPVEISIAVSRPSEKITQKAFVVYEEQKSGVFKSLLNETKPESTIVFTSSRQKIKEILRELKNVGFKAKGISSDLEQSERENVLNEFRSRQLGILVATDVLSRGIDIENIELVVNYDVPAEPEDYIHRIGRTARASATGMAVTFISPQDLNRFQRIERILGSAVEKVPVPEELGPAPEYNPVNKNKNKNRRKKPSLHQPEVSANSSKKTFKKRPFRRNNNKTGNQGSNSGSNKTE